MTIYNCSFDASNQSQVGSIPAFCTQYTLEVVIFLIIIFLIIFLVTSIGNFLVILCVILMKKLRTPSNILIINLATSDFLVSILVLPGAIYKQINGNYWGFSELLCDVFISFDVLLCTSSILNLCAISIDRYLVITKPFQYAVKRTPLRMFMMIAVSWVMSALISLPPMLVYKEKFTPGQCRYSENIYYQIYATCGAFYIPLLVMLVLYGRILKLAREIALADAKAKATSTFISSNDYTNVNCDDKGDNSKNSNGYNVKLKNSKSKSNNNDKKAIRTLGVIMGCFTLCWLPFFIIQLASSILDVLELKIIDYIPLWLIELFLWLGYINSLLNPVIYVKFNREFRAPLKHILLCHCASIDSRVRTHAFALEYGTGALTGGSHNENNHSFISSSHSNHKLNHHANMSSSSDHTQHMPRRRKRQMQLHNTANHRSRPISTVNQNRESSNPANEINNGNKSSNKHLELTIYKCNNTTDNNNNESNGNKAYDCNNTDAASFKSECPRTPQRSGSQNFDKCIVEIGPSFESVRVDSPIVYLNWSNEMIDRY